MGMRLRVPKGVGPGICDGPIFTVAAKAKTRPGAPSSARAGILAIAAAPVIAAKTARRLVIGVVMA
ncbi:hypothetical protein GCM10008941_27550 [Rhizomicrobium palustre]